MRFYEGNMSPEEVNSRGLIFTYGSNLAGRHGKGAALQAKLHHGAIPGVGIGRCGRSYAIPTKDERLNVLDLWQIDRHVGEFIYHTLYYPGPYLVTPVGTGLAGYRDWEIAPMFRGCQDCWLPSHWKPYL